MAKEKNRNNFSTDATKTESPNKIVQNQTGRRIGISPKQKGDQFILPPFGKRTVPLDELDKFDYEPWERQNLISVSGEVVAMGKVVSVFVSVIFWVFAIGIVLGLLVPPMQGSWTYWIIIGLTFASVLIIGYLSKILYHLSWDFFQPFVQRVVECFRQSFNLLFIIAIGVGLPAFVIFYVGGAWERVFIVISQVLSPDPINVHSFNIARLFLLSRGLQLILIAILSLIPALLYFLFDRQQMSTLRQNFFRDIILLDPNIVTLADAETMYGKRIEQIYGSTDGIWGFGRILRGTRSPILIATLVITLGWIIAIWPVAPISVLNIDRAASIYKLLSPALTPVNFGFIGAYFFALNMILRRYVRADLKPKAYSHITVRFLIVMVLVWAITLLPMFGDKGHASPGLLLFAFFIGIVPETGTAAIQEFLQGLKWLGKRIPALHESHPLSKLQGINLYNRARLFEEGVENIENLVHSDLIDLMLQTRVPVSRLVDWIDQGILYLHFADTAESVSSLSKEKGETVKSPSSLQMLHRYGIRTATDLELVFESAEERDKKTNRATKDVEKLLEILPEGRLRVILDAIKDDEWIAHIRNWRGLSRRQIEISKIDDFHLREKAST